MNQSLPIWITDHCQFGNHGEPFLWSGSGNDGVDIAIMQLINLVKDNPKLAHEAAEFIDACVKDAAQKTLAVDASPISAAEKNGDCGSHQ